MSKPPSPTRNLSRMSLNTALTSSDARSDASSRPDVSTGRRTTTGPPQSGNNRCVVDHEGVAVRGRVLLEQPELVEGRGVAQMSPSGMKRCRRSWPQPRSVEQGTLFGGWRRRGADVGITRRRDDTTKGRALQQ